MTNIIKPDPLHIQAYSILKSLILKGELQPGERLVEAKLARDLGISRGPVREAIRMLIQDGLLLQNDGAVRIYRPTKREIIEVFECRESLETLGIRLFLRFLTDDLERQLLDHIDEAKIAYKENRITELGELDKQFHDLIIQHSNNQQLIQLMSVIEAKTVLIRNQMVHLDTFPPFIDQHSRIINALLERDEEQAMAEMKQHLESGLLRILNNI
ncbi:hypothetical protein OXB_0655 [Bacillus sp. OxB-1]|uniref:GntR family transcriptional regulator n=1 Tax=Bacillus sp. (strain OxB-1) TaxID=98228 RepID=UPI000581FC7B|nr:GntR family transcriptional regulator [Bacillus sp. OxB-1]BAQ09127.1 hypothetical protein OXB_0655 [Bacillus sp. OxB-1]